MPQRILIIRLSAIGDLVMASPMAAALRCRYPDAHITWLVQDGLQELLEAHPGLDAVLTAPVAHWKLLWRQRRLRRLGRELGAFRHRLQAERFDLALDLQGLFKSGLLLRLSGAKRRVTLGGREGSRWLATETVSVPVAGQEWISSEYRTLARYLGLPDSPFPLQVAIPQAAATQADSILREHLGEAPYIALCPFTTRPQKHWQVESWLRLADLLQAQTGMNAVILGGPSDQPAGQVFADHPGIINLTGQTRLAESAAIIRGAHGLIGVDTGLTHMGTAFGIPTVALFGSTRPYLFTESPATRVIYHDLDCSPCRRRPTCGGSYHCLRDITPEEVLDVAAALLEPATA